MACLKEQRAVVVGAGIGGLSAATHLARAGWQVTIVDKNRRPGGRFDRLAREGHVFDTGPTLLVMPRVYEQEFAHLGSALHEALDLQRVDPTYHLVFDDGSKLALSSDPACMQSQLEAIERGSFTAFQRYMAEGAQHYELAMEQLVGRDFRSAGEFFTPANLALMFRIKALIPHYANMGAYFDEPRLKAAFSFQDVYMGLSPFEAASTFSLMPYCELAHGVWYPRGGMYAIVEALTALARAAGVRFELNARVTRIEVEAGWATAVRLADGRRLGAELVVANADLPYVYRELLPPDGRARRLSRKRYSCSVISFFWGLDRVYADLPPHTLFLADDFRDNFSSIERDLTLPENPSLYLHAPARLDSNLAPPGQDTLIGIVPVGHLDPQGGQDWRALRARARREVLQRLESLGIDDLEAHIKFEMCFTPQSWRKRYNLVRGATHGLSHTLTQLAYLRPHNRHPEYSNLYFAGASTHPGTGVPSALISGRLAAERALDDWG